MKTKPGDTVIKVEFLMNLTPDSRGKCTSEVTFSLPDHPGVPTSDETKRLAIDHVGQLCAGILTHPNGFPAKR
jgi:hypothetical protein